MYKLSSNSIIRVNGNQVILGNSRNGKWVRISKTDYEKLVYELDSSEVGTEFRYRFNILEEVGIIVKKDAEELYTEKLKSIMIAITNRCNLNCVHCGFSAGIEEKEELLLDDIKGLIAANCDVDRIIITGGEPLVHSNFYEVANFLGECFLGKKTLMTNTTLINRNNIEVIIKNFNSISISIDAASKETCDYMRGKGVFVHTMEVVKMLKESGFSDVSLSFVITDINKGEEEMFIHMCNDLGVKPMLRDLFTVGRGKENEENLKLKKLYRTASEVQIDDLPECRKKMRINGRCSAGRNTLYIQYDGNIFPCPVAGVNNEYAMNNLANLKDFNLQAIIDKRFNSEGYNKFYKVSPENVEHCSQCSVKEFCWVCIQEYYTYVCDDNLFIKFCNEQKKILEKVIWGD